MTDVFGDIKDASSVVEKPAVAALQEWLPHELAHQERRLGLPQGTLRMPEQWARVSNLIWSDDRLPALIVESPGMLGDVRKDRTRYMATWQLDVVVITAGGDEASARDQASAYIAACRGALAQTDPTLDGQVAECRWIGHDNHRAGPSPQNLPGQRAVYSTSFAVLVRDVLDLKPPGLPSTPPDDPFNPPGLPPLPTEAVIEIASEENP